VRIAPPWPFATTAADTAEIYRAPLPFYDLEPCRGIEWFIVAIAERNYEEAR
jgi:hypothetical protein